MAFIYFNQALQYCRLKYVWFGNYLIGLYSRTWEYIVELGDATRSFWQVCQEAMERAMSLQIPLVYLLVLVISLVSLICYLVKTERKRKTTNMVMFKKIDSLEEQLNMYQRVTQKLDRNLGRLDEDLKQLEQKHSNSEPLSARSDTMNDLLTEINTQLNKQHQKYESALSRLSDRLNTVSTDLYLTRAWKLNKSDDSLFTHQLCRSVKDARHLAYLHKNFISALNFLPRIEQLFDLLVELRRQVTNDPELDLKWYLALIDVNQKTDANFIEKIKKSHIQIFDLYNNNWDIVELRYPSVGIPTDSYFTIDKPDILYYTPIQWWSWDHYASRLNNYTPLWCNKLEGDNPIKSGIFIMLFTEVSLEAYQSTRRLCGLD